MSQEEGKSAREKISPLLREILAKCGVGADLKSSDFLRLPASEQAAIRAKSDAEIAKFLSPNYDETCYDPFLMPDMDRAVERIKLAKKRGEKITIYGDYDIDGMTATVILWESLNRFGIETDTYTPDRFTEGYGLNKDAVAKIAENGANLIITVDNGTLSFDEVEFANSLGVDVIITDHHSPHETLPDAVAVINPKIMPARFPELYDDKFRLRREVLTDLTCENPDERDKNFKTCAKGHKWSLGKTCMVCEPWRVVRQDYSKFQVNFSRISNDEKRVFRAMFYPFCDPCGAGVAFILVRALQRESLKTEKKWLKREEELGDTKNNTARKKNIYLTPLSRGQEKWLLDLVALGTVCDVVGLVDENRSNVYWGLNVMKRTRRPGIKALLAVAGVKIADTTSETLGFVLGPRLNAAGRMDTADWALNLLKLHDVKTAAPRNIDEKTTQAKVNARALSLAQTLNELNEKRRKTQDEIFGEAVSLVEAKFSGDAVLVVDGDGWHEGVIGIVAAKLVERFEKPTFVLARGEMEESIDDKNVEKVAYAKGSGRSFGAFSMAAAIHNADDIIERGGGHLAAGGLTVRVDKIADFRESVQKMYSSLNLKNQEKLLIPVADASLDDFGKIDENLVDEFAKMEPFGQANEAPVLEFRHVKIVSRRLLGAQKNHVKYAFSDDVGRMFETIAFSAADKFTAEPFDGETSEQNFANIRVNLMKNEWNGRVRIEGRLLYLEATERAFAD